MNLIKVQELFEVKYGVNLELNALEKVDYINKNSVRFVSRTAQNNGVSAIVKRVKHITPIKSGTITVAAGGSVLETFLQPFDYYTGRDVYYLTAKETLSEIEKLYYCACIRQNRYRYNYGRQANRTLKDIMIPDVSEIPAWVYEIKTPDYSNIKANFNNKQVCVPYDYKYFRLDEIFDIKKGKRLTKANMSPGITPFIAAIDKNNGIRQKVSAEPIHEGNTITVNYNGSVGEAFYQPYPFYASDDVNVLYPLFNMTKYSALYIITVIKFEKYRFNYGRKWHKERMEKSYIKLPVTSTGDLDINFMEQFIKTLSYSKLI